MLPRVARCLTTPRRRFLGSLRVTESCSHYDWGPLDGQSCLCQPLAVRCCVGRCMTSACAAAGAAAVPGRDGGAAGARRRAGRLLRPAAPHPGAHGARRAGDGRRAGDHRGHHARHCAGAAARCICSAACQADARVFGQPAGPHVMQASAQAMPPPLCLHTSCSACPGSFLTDGWAHSTRSMASCTWRTRSPATTSRQSPWTSCWTRPSKTCPLVRLLPEPCTHDV